MIDDSDYTDQKGQKVQKGQKDQNQAKFKCHNNNCKKNLLARWCMNWHSCKRILVYITTIFSTLIAWMILL